ncbi:hypothetical protein BRADI_4g17414v3 [Brachypodium distachyon]|uniref:Endonuclease/exonuclease/phosphatase domain-containing protein n=1 Tax=Brachypodium distachyon TaxID=15368 RepID=A0A2K2CNH7_BRADI|nr:hypothetical protein BRADI_4g17414v3 [Brachypodium distachyon]
MGTCVREIIWEHSLDFICLQETKKPVISAAYLRKFDPLDVFFWTWLPSEGKSGGILVGVKKDSFEVHMSKVVKYVVLVCLWDKQLKIKWNLMSLYGSAHDEFKDDFLLEMVDFLSGQDVPFIIGGDFNIIRGPEEKNQNYYHSHFIDDFNAIIHAFTLREIALSGGKFTWTNGQDPPTLVKLDRVLMSDNWEDIFPLVSVRKLPRSFSDHNVLLLTSDGA